jgi:hypothetical protein
MDLIREILLRVEANRQLDGTSYVTYDESDFAGHSREEIFYHIDLLFEAGFIKGLVTMESPAISRLTWEGHEFIASIKDSGIWEKVKERAKGLPELTIMLAWELAKAELKKRVGLP